MWFEQTRESTDAGSSQNVYLCETFSAGKDLPGGSRNIDGDEYGTYGCYKLDASFKQLSEKTHPHRHRDEPDKLATGFKKQNHSYELVRNQLHIYAIRER